MKPSLSELHPSLTFSNSKSVGSMFEKSLSSRIQYQDLMETLGVFKTQNHSILPTNIGDIKERIRNDRKKIPELGIPVDRRDAQMLIKWLDSLLNKVGSKNDNLENILESALSIYEICFHEIVRQVSIQCKERGELISRVWKAYISLLERALRVSQASQQSQLLLFNQEKEAIKLSSSAEVFRLRCEIEEKSLDILNHADKLIAKEDEINKLGVINKRLVHRLEIIRNHYEGVKKEIVGLKEENRILKGKLINTETEFIVNDHGVIEAQHKRLKLKRKSKENLQKIIKNDPIISSGNYIDPSAQENLNHDIASYESELLEIFNQADFQDIGIDAPVIILESRESQTELEYSCGNSEGEGKDKNDPTPAIIDLIDLHLQSLLSMTKDNTELVRQSTLKQDEVNEMLKDTDQSERINVLIDKMKENIGAVTSNQIRSLLNSVNSAIKDVKTSEMKPETRRLKTIRSKMWSVIQASRLKKTNDIYSIIIQKIKNTPQHKLKKILVKKILLKFITSFYESKMQKRSLDIEVSKKQDISQHIFESLANKYGPGKIAENKFAQICSSCIKYKHVKRVKLFGRFFKLYDDFDNEDLDTYFEYLIFLKNSQGKEFANSEYNEQLIITYEKAIDLYKSNFLLNFADSDRKSIKHWLELNKFLDNLYKVYVIDQDAYLEYLLERNRSKKYARVNFLRCIYEAADVRII